MVLAVMEPGVRGCRRSCATTLSRARHLPLTASIACRTTPWTRGSDRVRLARPSHASDAADHDQEEHAIGDRMTDHARPGAPRALCYVRERAATGNVRGKAEQRRVVEDVKRGPQHSVHDPGPAPVRELLTRQDVAAPPELFAEDVENDEAGDPPHEQPPVPGHRHAEKVLAARRYS